MKIYFATDHAGFELKEELITFVRDELHYEVHDFGASSFDAADDYHDFVTPAAQAVSNEKESRAIILGGSGQGEAMVANRIANIRATVYYGGDLDIVKLSREHNDANVLSIGARFVTSKEAKEAVQLWLATDFPQEERHVRRIEKIDSAIHI
ncbi:ribose-5-phosphate isomerase [Candidatus Kaiserbacteria bacterium]|nr:MAG: ribose-5-phosphate isomerase [Candidatus Kaiserbacteria bacterium]